MAALLRGPLSPLPLPGGGVGKVLSPGKTALAKHFVPSSGQKVN